MSKLYLLAAEPVPNQLQLDCRLIVKVVAPPEADNEALSQVAAKVIKEKFGEEVTLKPISEQAAVQYLNSDPASENGVIDFSSDAELSWYLVRIGP
jgi:hypothetical protein